MKLKDLKGKKLVFEVQIEVEDLYDSVKEALGSDTEYEFTQSDFNMFAQNILREDMERIFNEGKIKIV